MYPHVIRQRRRRRMLWDSYIQKVIGVAPDSLVGFWPQNETSGSVSYDRSGNRHNGAYTGVTLGQAGVPGMGYTSPLFDGANDFNNIYSAGLNADFNGAEGTLLAWAKVSGVGVWEDATMRYFAHFYIDAENYVRFYKHTTNNWILWDYRAGNVLDQNAKTDASTTDWFCLTITWSKSGDVLNYYYDGASAGTDTGLDTWAGDLDATRVIIGASVTGPADVWSGNIGPVVLWNKALTADQVAYLSTP